MVSRDAAALLHALLEATGILTVEDWGLFDGSCHDKYLFCVITSAKIDEVCASLSEDSQSRIIFVSTESIRERYSPLLSQFDILEELIIFYFSI